MEEDLYNDLKQRIKDYQISRARNMNPEIIQLMFSSYNKLMRFYNPNFQTENQWNCGGCVLRVLDNSKKFINDYDKKNSK